MDCSAFREARLVLRIVRWDIHIARGPRSLSLFLAAAVALRSCHVTNEQEVWSGKRHKGKTQENRQQGLCASSVHVLLRKVALFRRCNATVLGRKVAIRRTCSAKTEIRFRVLRTNYFVLRKILRTEREKTAAGLDPPTTCHNIGYYASGTLPLYSRWGQLARWRRRGSFLANTGARIYSIYSCSNMRASAVDIVLFLLTKRLRKLS